MKIHVNRIPEDGLKEHVTYDPTVLDMEREDIHVSRPFEVDAFITKSDKADGQSGHPLPGQSDLRRCLEEFEVPCSRSVLQRVIRPMWSISPGRPRNILTYPLIPVCRPDCKGCAAGGINRNRETAAMGNATNPRTPCCNLRHQWRIRHENMSAARR